MTYDPRNKLIRAGWGASAVAVSFAIAGTASHSQPGQRFELSGHVAPRCWAAAATALDLDAMRGTAAARCSQGTMPLSIKVRTPAPVQPEPSGQSKRAEAVEAAGEAIEIHVTPLL